jgi:hypothetical protein
MQYEKMNYYHSLYALYSEPKQSIDICCLMIPPNQMYILRIFNLNCRTSLALQFEINN